MKISTFNTRIAATATKESMAYKLALKILTEGMPTRTCWTSGSGRYTSNMDYTVDTVGTLTAAGLAQGIDYSLTNDAPQGGKAGNLIRLTPKGRRKMIAG